MSRRHTALAGFWSKLLIIMALWNSGDCVCRHRPYRQHIHAAYFLRLQRKVFFGKLLDKFAQLTEIGGSVKWAQIMLTVVTIAAGLFPCPALLGELEYFRRRARLWAVIYICLGLMLIFGILAVVLRSLLKPPLPCGSQCHAGDNHVSAGLRMGGDLNSPFVPG